MITITSFRKQLMDDYPVYVVYYPHPESGRTHCNVIPVEAVGHRAELFDITHREALKFILAENHTDNSETDPLYQEAISERENDMIEYVRYQSDVRKKLDAAMSGRRTRSHKRREKAHAIMDKVSIHNDADLIQQIHDDEDEIAWWQSANIATELSKIVRNDGQRQG